MQAEHRENVQAGIAEKLMYTKIQSDYDKAYGFNAFPYTHGEEVEKEQASATKKWRKELVSELEQKGAIARKSDAADMSMRGSVIVESELKEKAKGLAESKGKFFKPS